MDKNIRDAIDLSLKELKNMQDKVGDFLDSLPDDTDEIKATSKNALGQIKSLLNNAVEKAGDKTEEAQLQAHLGVMEAKDKLEASRAVFDDFLATTGEESRKLMDEVQLKKHLAAMEARDFWEERGSKLTEEFQASTETMKNFAQKAIGDMHSAFSKWNEQFNKKS